MNSDCDESHGDIHGALAQPLVDIRESQLFVPSCLRGSSRLRGSSCLRVFAGLRVFVSSWVFVSSRLFASSCLCGSSCLPGSCLPGSSCLRVCTGLRVFPDHVFPGLRVCAGLRVFPDHVFPGLRVFVSARVFVSSRLFAGLRGSSGRVAAPRLFRLCWQRPEPRSKARARSHSLSLSLSVSPADSDSSTTVHRTIGASVRSTTLRLALLHIQIILFERLPTSDFINERIIQALLHRTACRGVEVWFEGERELRVLRV